jgi:hypothetical protein
MFLLFEASPRFTELCKYDGPLWGFRVDHKQQRLLTELALRLGSRAHIAYAAPAFHTNADLFRHTRFRTIVPNSTFPPSNALINHDAWYYNQPGASGVANPEPSRIENAPLLERVRELTNEQAITEERTLFWVDRLANDILSVTAEAQGIDEGMTAQFHDDLQSLDRTLETFFLPPTVQAYARVRLFTAVFSLTWLVAARGSKTRR